MGTCGANVCTCPNGTPVVAVGTGGTFCGANADVDCSACNPGYSLSVTPAADTLSTCPANICTCQNGSPSVAAGAGATLCETDADVDCSACNVGYSPSVTPAAGTKSTCVANPCAATEVANSVDHSSTGAITGSTRDTVTVVCEAGYYEPNAAILGVLTNQIALGDADEYKSVRGVCVSPDGKNVYAMAALNDAIVYFDRNAFDGALTNEVVEVDSTNLHGGSRCVVSPDGKNVYATAAGSKSIVHWDRDATTGT